MHRFALLGTGRPRAQVIGPGLLAGGANSIAAPRTARADCCIVRSTPVAAVRVVPRLRTYDMDTDLPGPVEDLGGFIEMISTDAFRLTRSGETTTYSRCSNAV